MPPTTEPRRRWKWARRIGGLLLLLLIALTALDAWLKSWPIKVMAPCDAEVTVVYAPGIWGQWRQFSGIHVEQPEIGTMLSPPMDVELLDPGIPLPQDSEVATDVKLDYIAYFDGMETARAYQANGFGMSPGFWFQTIPGAIGKRYVLASQGNWDGLFFAPGLLGWGMMPWALFTAWMHGEYEETSGEFLLQYDGGFSITNAMRPPKLIELDLTNGRPLTAEGSVRRITEADGLTTVLMEHNYNLKALRSLWVRLPHAFEWEEGTSIPVTQAQEGTVFQLDCANPELGIAILDALTQIKIEFEMRSCYEPLQFMAKYPGLQATSSEAQSFRAMIAVPERSSDSQDAVIEWLGIPESMVSRNLETSKLLERSVPMEFAGLTAVAIQPSFVLKEPVLGWSPARMVMASSASAIKSALANHAAVTTSKNIAVLQVAAIPLYEMESSGRLAADSLQIVGMIPPELFRLQTLVGRMRHIEEGALAGDWIVFADAEANEGEAPAIYHPVAPCPEAAATDQTEQSTAPLWPHGLWQTVRSLLDTDNLYEARNAFGITGKQWPDIFGRDEPGGIHRPHGDEWSGDLFRSASPLVTQTAWSILTTAELYGALDAVDAGPFREEQAEAMQDWSNFLVRWKRGPDAAPLSCIEESAGPDDVYPLLVVYLGLKAGADWFHPDGDNVPEAWSHRLDDLRTELLAQLLQPGQCLTCPDLLMPLAEAIGQLSPAALDALHRLPPCPPPDREDYGVLPRCPPSP